MARILAVTVTILAAPGLFHGCSRCTCEECFGSGVAQEVTREAAKDYVYSAPLAETEAALREVLLQEGFDAPAGGPATRTSTLRSQRRGMPEHELLVVFSPVGASRYKLEVSTRDTWTAGDGGTQITKARALDTEYQVASRVDPAWAAKVNERAEKDRERARAVGPGGDRRAERGGEACENSARAPNKAAPVFGIELHGSAGASAPPRWSSSIECPSGDFTKAMRPSRGGRFTVTPAAWRRAHAA